MIYTYFTTEKLILIKSYYHQSKNIGFVDASLKRSKQSIALTKGIALLDNCQKYKMNKKKYDKYSFKRRIYKYQYEHTQFTT